MSARYTPESFGWVTRIGHWSLAFSILFMACLGWHTAGLSYYDAWYNDALELHYALGVLTMFIGWLFLIWSWTSARLAYPNGMSTTTRLLVRGGHAVLYALILIIPLSGYLTSTATGDGISIFGWAQLPTLAPLSDELRDAASLIHWMLAYALLIVVAGHAGAAIKHEWFDKDGTLRRMILGRVKPG